MATWIGLLRGINVGGNRILPMVELKRDLESVKLTNVRTYIQSGNVVFESTPRSAASITEKILCRIEDQHGFRPHLILLKRAELAAAVEANPFTGAASAPKTLHYFFLAEPALTPDTIAIDAAKSPTERYKLTDRVFYLYAPDGVGRSKLAASAERHLGVVTTARNSRTVEKLLTMAAQTES